MRFKIELRLLGGWNDASWTEESGDEVRPVRFLNIADAKAVLDEFFGSVKAAVASGGMDREERREDYRIVAADD